MALKHYTVPGIGELRVQRRKGTRSMRIRLAQDGTVTVSLPYWMPYSAGVAFATSHREWITEHRTEKKHLYDGQKVGMYHTLRFVTGTALRTRLTGGEAIVTVPVDADIADTAVQAAALRVSRRALEKESPYLGELLAEVAERFGHSYREVRYKFMKSRWGSCSSDKRITLSYRLLAVAPALQEYVIAHELAHTIHMNHSAKFWEEVRRMVPDYADRRKALRRVALPW